MIGICLICGRTRDHEWDGCICTRCGTIRNAGHLWHNCKCLKCNTIRNEQHIWNGCKCSNCNTIRDEYHKPVNCLCVTCGTIQHSWEYTFADMFHYSKSTNVCTVCKNRGILKLKCEKCNTMYSPLIDTGCTTSEWLNNRKNIIVVGYQRPWLALKLIEGLNNNQLHSAYVDICLYGPTRGWDCLACNNHNGWRPYYDTDKRWKY